MICFGFILTMLYVNRVIKGRFQKGIIENDHFLIIFLYSFVKFHGKKIGSHNMTVLCPYQCYDKLCYKGISLYLWE